MKGTDCTEAQIDSARQFCADRRKDQPGERPRDAQEITISFGQLARLVAWYGALRYMAGRDGTGGTLECPGPIDTREEPCQSTTAKTP